MLTQKINRKISLFSIIVVLMSCANESNKKPNKISKENSGTKVERHDNGKIETLVQLEDGIEHGLFKKFYDDGTIMESGIMIKGKKNGLWKFNDSSGQLVSAKHYYNDSLTHNLDIDDFSFIEKELNNDIQVKIPKNWTIVNEIDASQVLLVIKKECEKDISFCPNLTITYETPVLESIDMDEYLNKSDEVLKASFDDYRVVKEREYVYENITYFEKIYIGSSRNINIGGITTWVFEEDRLYIVTGLALNEQGNSFLKYEGLFKEITNNLQIE